MLPENLTLANIEQFVEELYISKGAKRSFQQIIKKCNEPERISVLDFLRKCILPPKELYFSQFSNNFIAEELEKTLQTINCEPMRLWLESIKELIKTRKPYGREE